VFQVKNPQEIAKLDDLFDNSKASIISLTDLPNSVLEGFNYENLGNAIRVKQSLKFKNSGLEKNFVVTDDNFALGDNKKLVNGKTYYFAALAFAYNNFKDTIRNTSQLEQLKFSSRINIVSGTPHDLENYNLQARAEDGQGIPVKRIFGQGSASFFLEIDKSEEEFIVKNYSKDDLLYKIGNVDKSEYDGYNLSTSIAFEKAIECYRVITGACSFGTKDFITSNNIDNFNTSTTYATLLGKGWSISL
jgi:hypothetical protein